MRKILIPLLLFVTFCFGEGSVCDGQQAELKALTRIFLPWLHIERSKDVTPDEAKTIRKVWLAEKEIAKQVAIALEIGNEAAIQNLHEFMLSGKYKISPAGILLWTHLFEQSAIKNHKKSKGIRKNISPTLMAFTEFYAAAANKFLANYNLEMDGQCALSVLFFNVSNAKKLAQEGEMEDFFTLF